MAKSDRDNEFIIICLPPSAILGPDPYPSPRTPHPHPLPQQSIANGMWHSF